LKTDRVQAWRDLTGWRVNYDRPVIELCSPVMAPQSRQPPMVYTGTKHNSVPGCKVTVPVSESFFLT
jgi:hypothetical protein